MFQGTDNVVRSWQGSGIKEEGIDVRSGKTIVKVDPGYFRPAEVECVLSKKVLVAPH
jgi:GDPmannose 4,6-dehydratase